MSNLESFATILFDSLSFEFIGIEIFVMVTSRLPETSPEIKNGGRLAHFKMGYNDEFWGATVQASHIQIHHFKWVNL